MREEDRMSETVKDIIDRIEAAWKRERDRARN